MTDENNCFCFSSGEKFRNEYFSFLKENTYLAEKTVKTATDWLGGKQKVRNFDLVPFYATSDFTKYVCTNNDQAACTITKMSEQMHLEEITKAINAMASKCPCE